MGADGAVNIIFREKIKNAKDPVKEKAILTEDYQKTLQIHTSSKNLLH